MEEQKTLVGEVIQSSSDELLDFLGERSIAECRRGNIERGIEVALLALTLLEGNAERFGERYPCVTLLGRARLANAFRLSGDYHQAERLFLSVEEEWSHLTVKIPRVEVEIFALKASLRLFQRQFEEAQKLLTHAVDICEDTGPPRLLAQCLIQRAELSSLRSQTFPELMGSTWDA